MFEAVCKAIGFAFSALILIACALALGVFAAGCGRSFDPSSDGSGFKAVRLPTPPGYCACPSCDCACKGDGGGLCHCSLDACDCPCDRFVCTPEGCKIVPRYEKAHDATELLEPLGIPGTLEVEGDPLPPAPPGEASIESTSSLPDGAALPNLEDLIGKPTDLECPDERLAGDVPERVRLWYRNRTAPGSCVQCSIGLAGCAQNVPNASLLLWPTEFGPAELHGSYPSRVAAYARERGLAIYNVTGSQTYAWMKWATRNGRPCAVGCKTAHFQTLFGHDPRGEGDADDLWYVVDNNSPQTVDVYTDREFRALHQASGEWCVILDAPPGPARPEVVHWWASN